MAAGTVIWIINHYAGSRVHGMEYRHYYLAQHFARMGLRPAIVCASFHHLLTKMPEGRTADVDGIPYVWIQTRRYEKNDARRALNMVDFSARLLFTRLGQLPKPDVVIASSPHPFVAFNGYRIARRYGAKFIFEVRDLWPLTLIEIGGHSPRHPFIRAMAWAERLGYERCDHTVSLSAGTRDYMVAHGLDERKFVHIPNGMDLPAEGTNVEPLPEEHRRVIEDLRGHGKLIVLYSGSHGVVNALENVLDAAGLLRDEPAVHFLLVGQGPQKESLRQRAQQAGLTNVTFLPSVARSQMPALTQSADLGYVGLQKKDLFKYGVSPNKLYEYMAAGLPILWAIEMDRDEVAEAQCGFSMPAEDPAALATVLRQAVAIPRDQLREMGERGRLHLRETHTYETLARQYACLF
ncbi:MAG: glycosyltransferase family 4 protein [Phycisphaerae bacterium]|nr:glycosyltransferase family 4 protein [Phycisphaerae bacterium]